LSLKAVQGALNAVAMRRRKVQKRAKIKPSKIPVAVLGGRTSAPVPVLPA
jgi:hypothetical protein